jgi:scyllo-inositol 2-dehydrogenase (NADP+)
MIRRLTRVALAALLFGVAGSPVNAQDSSGRPLRLAIAGLVHGHVDGFLRGAAGRTDVQIVGVFDPDETLRRKYAARYSLPETALFGSLDAMLDGVKPEAVAAFTSTLDHAMVVEAAAKRHIDVMMEKPLAVSNAEALRIRRAAESGGIDVLVNYETTWYRSYAAIGALAKDPASGTIRKMVAMDGHAGPKAINVQPEFFAWLTDPVRNGAGALFDFGCYGANLMTWLMGTTRPVAVTAVTQKLQPAVYTRVEDEATILVEYPGAQGIIQASWNWPFNRKDLELYAANVSAIGTGGNDLLVSRAKAPNVVVSPAPLPADERDSISHLIAVARGQRKPNALSSLENNLIVTEILDAARESARAGRRIELRRAK